MMLEIREWLLQLEHLSPLWALLALAILPGIGFPVFPILIACSVWGAKVGMPIALIGLILNSSWTYLVGRYIPRETLERLPLYKRFKGLPPLRPTSFVLLIRLTPGLPLFLQNLLLGATKTPFPTYIIYTTLYQATWVILVVGAGNAYFKEQTILFTVLFVILCLWWMIRYFLLQRTAPATSGSTQHSVSNHS